MNDKPTFVSRDIMTADEGYVQWMADIKQRFRQSQLKAAVRVNTAMLEFYWSVGRDLVALRAEERWGAGVVKQFALDMRKAFPNETGFSYSNVKYMKLCYLYYYEIVIKGQQSIDQIGHQAGDQLEVVEKSQQVAGQIETLKKGQQAAGQLEMPEIFGRIPWFHHVQIISKCKTLDEALFYIDRVVEEGWSRSRLENQIAANLFGSQGAAITNFSSTLPDTQSQLAKENTERPLSFRFPFDERGIRGGRLGRGACFQGDSVPIRIGERVLLRWAADGAANAGWADLLPGFAVLSHTAAPLRRR